MVTFRFGEEVLPGIKALDASGHTPGHTVFETDSLLIVGDLLHAAALQIPRPEVCTIYDMNPSGGVQARLPDAPAVSRNRPDRKECGGICLSARKMRKDKKDTVQ